MDTESVDTSKNILSKLEYDDVLDLMKNYGYSSASSHPFIYQNGDDLGICYSYRDAEYGNLERIKLFEDKESVEEYLKTMKWLETNGPMYHVRMSLDNFETVYPRILFLRKEQLMVPGEMDDIDTYDFNMSKRANLDDTSKLLYEAGDLLVIYDEIKARQLAYINNLTVLKNSLRKKYYDLQLEVDKYNRIGKIERNVSYLPNSTDDGIDITMEITIKDRYNQYVAQTPSYDDVYALVKDIWELNKNLELNNKYYEVQVEDNNIRNEIKLVEAKLELMKDLNDDVKGLFGVDLVSKFRKINREFASKSNSISDEYIQKKLNLVEKKYSVFDKLRLLDLSEYLREGFSNTNYDDMVSRYAKDRVVTKEESIRLPLNEVAANLSVQYKEHLDTQEQAILILHNNPKYREIFDAILQIENFDTIPIKQVLKKVGSIKGFSKLKSECFDTLKKRVNDPLNANIKSLVFQGIDFTNFESFISSFIPLLVKLRNMNDKMVLNSDINMYTLVNNAEDILKERFTFITNDLDTLYILSQNQKTNIALILLKKGLPVLYAPYTFDLGDIYSKNASPQMYIKEYVGFDLLVEHEDMNISISEDKVSVVNYQSEKEVVENLTTATSLYTAYKTTFCKLTFLPKNVQVKAVQEEVPVPEVNMSTPFVPPAPVVEEQPKNTMPDLSAFVAAPSAPVVEEVKEEEKEEKVEIPEEPKVEEPKEEKVEIPEEPKVEEAKEVPETPKVEEPKEEPKEEVPKVEEKPEEKKEEPKEEKKELPKEEPKNEEKKSIDLPIKKEDKPPLKTITKVENGVVKKVVLVPKKKEEVKPVLPIKKEEVNKPPVNNTPVVKKEEVNKPPVNNNPVVKTKVIITPDGKKIIKKFIVKPKLKEEVKPVQPVVKPVQPATKPVQQVSKPVQNVAKPGQPVGKPVQPATKPVQQVSKPVQNIAKPGQPVTKPVQNVAKPTQLVKKVVPVQNKPGEPVKKVVDNVSKPNKVVKTKVIVTPDGKKIVKKIIVGTNKAVQTVAKPVQSNIDNKPINKGKE